MAEKQLERFLRVDNAKKLTRGVFAHIGRVAAESADLTPAMTQNLAQLRDADNALINELLQERRPVLALTAHFGNWELMAATIASFGREIVTVGRELRYAPLQRFIAHNRAKAMVRTIWRGGVAGQKDLIRAMKTGNVVAALIDQDTRVHAESAQFFGYHVATPSSMIDMALRHKARIVTAFNYRTVDGGYIIEVEEILTSQDVLSIIDVYHQRLEDVIRRHPEQWVWFHKRWRTLADGRRLSSEEYLELLSNA
jgi:KDO2-lipid IV(A) lauroyltransferase